MQADYLIVGQGICGTLLSWMLHREGKSVIVVDDEHGHSSSKLAAGIINPVTGRPYAHSWMIDELLPFALTTYRELEAQLHTQLIFTRSVIDFFPTVQARQTFIKRMEERDTYLHAYPDQNHFNQDFNYELGCGEIRPAYTVNLALLIADWRKQLIDAGALVNEAFRVEELELIEEGVRYGSITAGKIIFCEGATGAKNPCFELLPFSPNKGEALVIECRDLRNDHIFKHGLLLAPLPVQDTFWVGANYTREFADLEPTPAFYEQTTSILNRWLKRPYRVLIHKAAVRPATVERRPFVGLHPTHPQIGILNGMGSKGTSLAPYFAHQLTRHLVHDGAITPQADVRRFTRMLTK